jgi:hypothetical protein
MNDLALSAGSARKHHRIAMGSPFGSNPTDFDTLLLRSTLKHDGEIPGRDLL